MRPRGAANDVPSSELRTKAIASYWTRFLSVKRVLSSVASNSRLCSAARDRRASIALGIESCL